MTSIHKIALLNLNLNKLYSNKTPPYLILRLTKHKKHPVHIHQHTFEYIFLTGAVATYIHIKQHNQNSQVITFRNGPESYSIVG